ncbi:signal recognition particle subunit SRP19/SEC65 family protein [Candidatus Nitrosocosmicus arcticus]|uniref:Signal recognition particle 19 kDa protein n=1 Tax=Candidatus Nitrosocosmicus arcticus TaxID=2035267 RepID=A0A557STD5_9ARCH|nr:signal recognition particle subunit SRP19/SEC65 family protein [Candidatus Nitrosocosmicus arcticus]TVP39877.1 Signal recognition particle 19 kDa protein [Candidatus Nitrosocosmicus arcticus]
MKDYENVIIWVDYYNKNFSRGKGRKLSKSLAVYDPMISELVVAVESLGYHVEKDQINDGARFPKRPHIKSGYIMIAKNESLKSKILKDIAEKMILNRTKLKGR